MIPVINNLDDVRTVIRHQRRWRPRQRVIVLRTAKRKLLTWRTKGDLTAEEFFAAQAPILRLLAQEERNLKLKGRTEERPPWASIDATPAAILAAKESGIDLSKITGSGKDGKILKRDVIGEPDQ